MRRYPRATRRHLLYSPTRASRLGTVEAIPSTFPVARFLRVSSGQVLKNLSVKPFILQKRDLAAAHTSTNYVKQSLHTEKMCVLLPRLRKNNTRNILYDLICILCTLPNRVLESETAAFTNCN